MYNKCVHSVLHLEAGRPRLSGAFTLRKYMNFKSLSKEISSKFILIGFVIALVPAFYLVPVSSSDNDSLMLVESVSAASRVMPVGSGFPVNLKIPKIKVDAKMESVGVTSEGAIDVPKNFSNVAWYNLGPRPGDSGSSIITGHYGKKNGKSSVFDNLYKIRKGDRIYVKDDKGVTISFIVKNIKRYSATDKALDVFSSSDGKSHLNIITCEGTWNRILKSYSKRLVIFTDRE